MLDGLLPPGITCTFWDQPISLEHFGQSLVAVAIRAGLEDTCTCKCLNSERLSRFCTEGTTYQIINTRKSMRYLLRLWLSECRQNE